ncbi:DUF732 domain-containing protein [Mycobacterium sp. 852002-10029_SCH5224772]|uniref:DUF732 domain-containing protein n=1 Tax=Mycobacterium sp. 852002-10029_SCH5224772 TaxID=1834083 RepID=UPI000ACE9DF3|nr:DUF732 domain-containing protein [Mycobacterium sp. 852002-10029_SCH5224772]
MLFRATFITTGAFATGAAVAGIAFAAPAQADETAYITDMHNAGIANDYGDSGLLKTGWQACESISSGLSPGDVKARILYNSDSNEGASGITPDQANDIVNYAMVDLCPSA